MAVLAMGTSTTDKLFLEYVMPGFHVQIKEHSKLYDRFKTDTSHVVGKYALFKCLTASPTSARPSSSSTLPTAKQGTYDEFLIYMKRAMYAQLQFDGLALACSKGKGAIMDVLKAEMEGMSIYIARKLNRQFWGDGSGRLAAMYAAVSNSTAGYVDSANFGVDSAGYTDPANYLDVGAEYDIYTTAGSLEEEGVTISAIGAQTAGYRAVTFDRAITCAADSYVFDHDTYAASQAAGTGVPMGLHGIIEASDPYTGITATSFQNIDRDTYEWARAQEVNMSSLAVTNSKILETVMKIEKFGKCDVIITNEKIWTAIFEEWEGSLGLKTDPAMWGGTTGLSFYGGKSGKIPIIYDFDCPDNIMMFLDSNYLQVYSPYEKGGMTWLPGDNGILTRVAGKDEWVASMVHYNNFGTNKPQALGKLYAVKHAAA
jgi:hypothetical protein